MRVAGIILIGILVSSIGFIITNRLLTKAKQLKSIILMIKITKQKILYNKETVYKILKGFSTNDYDFLFKNTFDYNEICFNNNMLLIDNEQKTTLYEYFCSLGTTDVSGQVAHCENYIDLFSNYLSKCEKENSKKINLYPSLFILLGMLIVLILI